MSYTCDLRFVRKNDVGHDRQSDDRDQEEYISIFKRLGHET
jgi:hypothetical protein